MSADLATLGLAIDSRPATDASTALDRLAQSARGAGQAADTFSASAGKGAPALQQTGAAAAQAAVGLDRHTKALNDNAKAAGLSFLQFEVLKSSVLQFGDQVAAGASPLHAFTQQAIGAAAAVGEDGLSGLAKRASVTVSGFGTTATAAAQGVGVAGAAIGGLGAIIVGAGAALVSYRAQQEAVATSLLGIGRASGATVSSINRIAEANAVAGGVSVSTARNLAAGFASTGKIGDETIGNLVRTIRDYASTVGVDIPTAAETFQKAYSNAAEGADLLNARLGFLDAASRENIRTLQATGDQVGARRALFDAMAGSISKADERLGFFSRQWQQFSANTSNEIDGIGKAFDRILTGGDLETRLATAQKVLANSQARQSYLPFGIGEADTANAQSVVDRLKAEVAKQAADARRDQVKAASLEVDNLVKQYDPAAQRLKQMGLDATKIQTELGKGVLDPDGRSQRTMQGLRDAARELAADLAKGGSELARGIRDAQFALKTVGFSPSGQRVADINRQADEDLRAARADPTKANNIDAVTKGIEERRQIQLQAAREETQRNAGGYGTALRDVPEQYRDRVQRAADAYGVNPNLLSSVFSIETGGFQDSVITGRKRSPAGAVGPFQFMPDTAKQYGVDPLDFDSSANGAAHLLADRLRARRGNEALALADYNWGQGNVDRVKGDVSRFPDETRNYISKALVQGPDTAAQVQEQQASARTIATANEQLKNSIDLYGRNGAQLEINNRVTEMLSQAQAKNVDVTDSLRASYVKTATESVMAEQALRGSRSGADLQFDRDQLGRSVIEQRAYASARNQFGDVTSEQSRAYITQANDNARLTEARSTLTSAAQSFASDLMHGRSAAQAFSGALSQISSKILNSVIDSAVGSLFKSSGGGILSSIFGHADGGMISGPGGPREDRVLARLSPGEFVVNARSASQNLGLLHVINSGGAPRFSDGGSVLPTMPNLAALPTMPAPANTNAPAAGPQALAITIDARGAQGNSEVQAAITRGVSAGMAQVQQNIGRNINGIVANGQRRYPRAG